MSNAPTEEDFARADLLMKHRDKGLSSLRSKVWEKFKADINIQKISILWQRDVDYRVYLFVGSEAEKERFLGSKYQDDFIDFILSNLAEIKEVDVKDLTVEFEFDSDENVQKNYEGDYFLRLK